MFFSSTNDFHSVPLYHFFSLHLKHGIYEAIFYLLWYRRTIVLNILIILSYERPQNEHFPHCPAECGSSNSSLEGKMSHSECSKFIQGN